MIDSEDVPEHKESSLPTNDQGFIDESDDD
jgi:hypothetical protein